MTVVFRLSPPITNEAINSLFASAWPEGKGDYAKVLARSIAYVCAYDGQELVGFVNLAWDGGVHGFVLDTTVAPSHQRRGIGTELVRRATDAAKAQGLEWLHVDYEPDLEDFYAACGFRPATAGLINLQSYHLDFS